MKLMEELKCYIDSYQNPDLKSIIYIEASYKAKVKREFIELEETSLGDYAYDSNIEDFINNNKLEETFSSKILSLIDQSGKTDPEVYKDAGVDRRLFSKIRSNMNYKPSKNTAISLCLALHLNKKEAEHVLQLAGYSFSPNDIRDLIILFFIEKKIYNLMTINEALDYFSCSALGTE